MLKLLKTKSSSNNLHIQTVSPGIFHYFKIQNSLNIIYNSNHQYFFDDIIKIVIGVDGLPLSKSSSSCFWPILGYIRNPHYKPYVFLIGLYWGKDKPLNCNDFLLDLVNELKYLYKNGFQTKNGIKRVVVDTFCCDLPAKSFILKTKVHTGFFSCTRCMIEGVYYERRVCFPGVDFTKRTHLDFIIRTDEEFHMTDNIPIITEIPEINLVDSFSLDYMHLVCLGVTKKLILLRLGIIKNSPTSVRLQSKKVIDVNKQMLSLKHSICIDFSRLPRGLNEVLRWKATEFRQFLLYTGPVVLKNIINDNCYLHFVCLHIDFRILLTQNSSTDLINFVEKLLIYFVNEFEELYGRQFVSLNIHGLLHVVADYKKYGPLDNCSFFPFENYMKTLKKMIRKHEKPLEQVMNRYNEYQTFRKSNILNISLNPIEYLKQHNSGPMLEECTGPQFKIVIKNNIKINIKSQSDCYIGFSCNGKLGIFKIVNVCIKNSDKSKVFIAKQFKNIQPFYKTPINSLKLGIGTVNEFYEPLITLDIEKIEYSKYIILHNTLVGNVAFPILHSDIH